MTELCQLYIARNHILFRFRFIEKNMWHCNNTNNSELTRLFHASTRTASSGVSCFIIRKTIRDVKLTMNRRSSGVQNDILGPIPETICSRSAQIRSCDPDRPIAFHKRRLRAAHQIEKIRNQTVYSQLNHDINHSLGNLVLKLRDCDWMKNLRLMISIHDVTMGDLCGDVIYECRYESVMARAPIQYRDAVLPV